MRIGQKIWVFSIAGVLLGTDPGPSTRLSQEPTWAIQAVLSLSSATEVDILPGDVHAFKAFSVCSRLGKKVEDVFTVAGAGAALQPGVYRLRYEVCSDNLPPCSLFVKALFRGDAATTVGSLVQ